MSSETVENNLENLNIKQDHNQQQEDQEDVVDPWNVASSSAAGVNYDKLIGK